MLWENICNIPSDKEGPLVNIIKYIRLEKLSHFLSYFLFPSFLSYSDLLYPLIVGVKGYCCTLPHTHNDTHTQSEDSSGEGIGLSQRPVLNNTQHSQEADIHGPGRSRSRNPSKRAAAEPRLKLRMQN